MRLTPRSSTRLRLALVGAVSLLVVLQAPLGALASTTLLQISADPFTNPDSAHKTQVEPDTFAYGSTIVAVTQSGRFFDGGSSDIGWATSTDNGATWTARGFLPGTTVNSNPPGPYARVSDPSVAYDAKYKVWLISSLPLNASVTGLGPIVNRSTDGGLTFGTPILVSNAVNTDKDWIVCDNHPSSPFYGNCYVEYDLPGRGDLIQMSTSTDGGLTWGASLPTADHATGLGGQPLVQPNGTVIVPIQGFNMLAFESTNGGASWSSTVTIATIRSHAEAGGLRSGPLPSAEINAAGTVYVVWQDCRFETGCSANDIVLSASADGVTWSKVRRIPIDPRGSGVDHFIPGLAVDPATTGGGTHLGLTYYYYPNTNCTQSTCQLDIGFVSSTDDGRTWSAPIQLTSSPMMLSWLAPTNQGVMVGDYISTSWVNGKAFPAVAVAGPKSGSVFNEALNTVQGGLTPSAGVTPMTDDQPVTFSSDHATPPGPLTAN